MPLTVKQLFDEHELSFSGPVPLGAELPVSAPGLYVISLSEDPERNDGLRDYVPLDPELLAEWLERAQFLMVDEERPRIQELHARLSEFWFPDENILFIDIATESLAKTAADWSVHRLGDPKPLRSGYWLKAFRNDVPLYMYYARSREGAWLKESCLSFFMEQVSPSSLELLLDQDMPIPFANLKITSRHGKKHGMKNMTV
jgi:hypothetical protein